MMTKEEVAQVIAYCEENEISYKQCSLPYKCILPYKQDSSELDKSIIFV